MVIQCYYCSYLSSFFKNYFLNDNKIKLMNQLEKTKVTCGFNTKVLCKKIAILLLAYIGWECGKNIKIIKKDSRNLLVFSGQSFR